MKLIVSSWCLWNLDHTALLHFMSSLSTPRFTRGESCVDRPLTPLLCTLYAAKQILDQFREQFIDEMEKVVFDLLEADIIDKGDQRTITEAKDTTQQNKILHRCLKEKCTLDALRSVCGFVKAVKGNPKMAALGDKMMPRLDTETGKC